MKVKAVILLLLLTLVRLVAQEKRIPNYFLHSALDELSIDSNLKYCLSNAEKRLDSLISTNSEGISVKHVFELSKNGNVISLKTLYNANNKWQKVSETRFLFDDLGNKHQDIYVGWKNERLDSISKTIYKYRSDGKLDEYVIQYFVSGSWINQNKTTYTYLDNKKEKGLISYTWGNNDWQYRSCFEKYYSIHEERDSIIFFNWDGNTWQKSLKSSFHYVDNSEVVDTLSVDVWENGSWAKYMKRTIIKDQSLNQLLEVDQFLTDNYWQNNSKRIYNFAGNKLIDATYKFWDRKTWFDANGDLTFEYNYNFKLGFTTHKIKLYYTDVTSQTTEENTIPSNYSLSQNYPNPFNPETTIEYTIPHAEHVTLKVFDVLGREVATLVDEYKQAGAYKANFNASGLVSGVYFYLMQAGSYGETKKMIFLK